eukprot:scaffold34822_cov32-Tisochrysis_lutea.AAC.2
MLLLAHFQPRPCPKRNVRMRINGRYANAATIYPCSITTTPLSPQPVLILDSALVPSSFSTPKIFV